MSDRRFWLALAALLLTIGALVGWGTRAAVGAPSLAQPGEYLARHGLSAPPTPFALVPADDPYLVALRKFHIGTTAMHSPREGSCIPDPAMSSDECPGGGLYVPHGIRVQGGQAPVELVYQALHEYGHAISAGARPPIDCRVVSYACQRPYVRVHEEGLADAWALVHLPTFWRWLTGRPMSAQTIENMRRNPSYGESGRWLRAAAHETKASRWSRPSREWLGQAMSVPLEDRAAFLGRWT